MFQSSFLCSVLILTSSIWIVQGCFRFGSSGERICCSGYSKNYNGECIADCKNCEHGICFGKNLCICRYGHSNNTCKSLCDSRCKNGSCVNDSCVCNAGFAMVKSFPNIKFDFYDYDYGEEELEECKPICKNCFNGQCISPSECQCNEGFIKSALDICEPACDNCTNGHCIEPNQCRCYPGYRRKNNECVPHCYGNCPDEKCIRPGQCKCDEGFKWANILEQCVANCVYTPCKQSNEKCDDRTTGKCECKSGYKRNSETNQCEPICDDVCVNGHCTAPNICSCNDNFTHKNLTYCEPKCEPLCPRDSTCQVDGTCKCDAGFRKFEQICLKDCKCLNGACIDKVNGCICYSGFYRNPKNASECITKCQLDGCENGFCGNNGKDCLCNLTYQKDNTTGKCVKCEEGTVCNGEFVPFECDPPCKHGLCVQKNVCACKHGYDKTEESHVCEPVCHGGCANGVCYSPKNCTCNEGYETVAEKCQPVCEQQCINGLCIAPNVCKCTEGHEFVHNSQHKCQKIKCHHGEHHKNHKDCHPNDDSKESSASEAASTSSGGVSVWIIVLSSFLAIALLSAAAFGIIWYMKSTRNSSISVFENFVYNRMTE